MKKVHLLLFSLITAALLTTLQPGPVAALSLDFSPSSTTLSAGDNLDVDIVLSGLTAAGQIVAAFDLDVAYNAALLTATDVSFGLDLGDPNFWEALTDFDISAPGIVDLAELSLLSDTELGALQGDSVTLATMSFTAIGGGLAEFAFLWGPGQDIKGFGNQVIYPGQPIPEPATMLLVGGGLAGLAARLRRRKTTA